MGYFYNRVGKRILDIGLVVLSAVVSVPIVVVLALIVAKSGLSPFFLQTRVGKHGEPFRMLKLRSMVPDAEAKLDAFLAENPQAAEEWRVSQKLRSDPRVTRIGYFLRKTSLDEMPQLWNVLKGDMSLVGPRPMVASQRSLYPGTAYYELRPGLTGSWQISSRHESEFASRSRHDTEYARTVSLWTDVVILLRTVGVVIRGTGC